MSGGWEFLKRFGAQNDMEVYMHVCMGYRWIMGVACN